MAKFERPDTVFPSSQALDSTFQTDVEAEAANTLQDKFVLHSTYYGTSGLWTVKPVSAAADRYEILSPDSGGIRVGGMKLYWETQQTLDLGAAATWDSATPTDYTTAANRAGKDFYIYACQPTSGTTPVWIISASSSSPSGYNTTTSRKVGGFHCLCVAVAHQATLTAWAADTVIALGETRKSSVWDGYIYRCTARANDFKTHATTEPNWASIAVGGIIVDDQITWIKELHALEDYVAGDILPYSVWCLDLRPECAPEGMCRVPGRGWADIYLQSGTGATTASVYGGTIAHNLLYAEMVNNLASVKKRFPYWSEFLVFSKGSNQNTPIAGAADPAATGGKSDGYGRRMVSNYGHEDCCGSHHQPAADHIDNNFFLLGGVYNGGTTSGTYYPSGGASMASYQNINAAARGFCDSQIMKTIP